MTNPFNKTLVSRRNFALELFFFFFFILNFHLEACAGPQPKTKDKVHREAPQFVGKKLIAKNILLQASHKAPFATPHINYAKFSSSCTVNVHGGILEL